MKLFYYEYEFNGNHIQRGPYFSIAGMKQVIKRWVSNKLVGTVVEYELVQTKEYSREEFLAITSKKPYHVYTAVTENDDNVVVIAKDEWEVRRKLDWKPVKSITCIIENVIR